MRSHCEQNMMRRESELFWVYFVLPISRDGSSGSAISRVEIIEKIFLQSMKFMLINIIHIIKLKPTQIKLMIIAPISLDHCSHISGSVLPTPCRLPLYPVVSVGTPLVADERMHLVGKEKGPAPGHAEVVLVV